MSESILKPSETQWFRLLVSQNQNHQSLEVILWDRAGNYLATYRPEKFTETKSNMKTYNYLSNIVRDYFLEQTAAALSIGSDHARLKFSLASPCPTYIYKKVDDYSEILSCSTETICIGRILEYVLLEVRN